MTQRGLFDTFEGGEGSGKTTQVDKFVRRLRSELGIRAIQTKQPGGSDLGVMLREILLHGTYQMDELVELLLFAADRAYHVPRIEQYLANGDVVISDRYTDSTEAYQGYARQGDLDIVRKLNRIASRGLVPNKTVYLRVDPEVGLARVDRREDENTRFDNEELAFHTRLRDGFDLIAAREPDRVIVIDANPGIEEVAEAVWAAMLPTLQDYLGGR